MPIQIFIMLYENTQEQKTEDVNRVLAENTKEWDNDIKFDQLNIRDEFLPKLPSIMGKWIQKLENQKAVLIGLENNLKNMTNPEKVDEIYKQWVDNGQKPTKSGIENLIKNTKTYTELKFRIEKVKLVVSQLEGFESQLRYNIPDILVTYVKLLVKDEVV